MRIAFFTQYPQPNDIPTAYYNHDVWDSYAPRAFIETSGNTDKYMVVFCYNNSWEYADGKTFDEIMSTVMVSEGAEMSVPYEPYGYKIPPTVNGTEYTIYLGSCQSTRRIKKRVLTGDESWTKSDIAFYTFIQNAITYGLRLTTLFCSHYQCIDDGRSYNDTPNNTVYSGGSAGSGYSIYFKTDAYSNVDAWKQWLADQYAAGTPVTVWYVLATPETGIVNEPLQKIGDYAE